LSLRYRPPCDQYQLTAACYSSSLGAIINPNVKALRAIGKLNVEGAQGLVYFKVLILDALEELQKKNLTMQPVRWGLIDMCFW
jgi:hypothetical protein